MISSTSLNRESRRSAVIFDVDGTLCDVRTVRHFVQAPTGIRRYKPNFDMFHSASAQCPAHAQVRQLALRAHYLKLSVIVVTGREAKWRNLTADWLAKHQIPCDELKTRDAKDYRPDHEIKTEIEVEISKRFRVLMAVDDRRDIISVWHAAGIPTVQVGLAGEVQPVETPPNIVLDPRISEILAGEVSV